MARTFVLKLYDFLDGVVGYRKFISTLRGRPSQEQIDTADRKGKKFVFDFERFLDYTKFC